ncbi:hypothetical protein CV_2415 [Chromobacterium violaceum ATCC 12472]|uniref:Uncharacterized protein n=1 Tax=Chromobacterium violaceum (strain ATCC 12472 / DSM 30191 / JCM 1249 / CCUG 213 / NBRC 12614 / NCIMB 9131 / NCTC 9757 / MK) TaxID=243365 RepID=Q7NVC8_CHRVO|nr:hypothetical protein CV_2415 [Chromobacterium violaceum ATCC 12472]
MPSLLTLTLTVWPLAPSTVRVAFCIGAPTAIVPDSLEEPVLALPPPPPPHETSATQQASPRNARWILIPFPPRFIRLCSQISQSASAYGCFFINASGPAGIGMGWRDAAGRVEVCCCFLRCQTPCEKCTYHEWAT